jgi:hypothetical protein
VEHSLADEMAAWSIDIIRAYKIIDRTIGVLDEPHEALVPANILIDADDSIRLVDVVEAVLTRLFGLFRRR